jgi:Na+/phosphate symporter
MTNQREINWPLIAAAVLLVGSVATGILSFGAGLALGLGYTVGRWGHRAWAAIND